MSDARTSDDNSIFCEVLASTKRLLQRQQRRSGWHVQASAIFDKAIRLRPGDAELINNRGSALTEAKRHDEALDASPPRVIFRQPAVKSCENCPKPF
jgi:hypothetical protein